MLSLKAIAKAPYFGDRYKRHPASSKLPGFDDAPLHNGDEFVAIR